MEENNFTAEDGANWASQFSSQEDYLNSLPEGVRKDLEIGGQTEAKGINAALTLGPLAAKPVLLKTLLGGTASLIKNNPLKTLDVVMTGVGASDIIDNPQDIAFETMSQKFDAIGGLKTRGFNITGQFVYDQLSSMFKGNTLRQLAPVVPSVNKSNLNVLKTVEPVIQPSGGSTLLQSVDNLDGVFGGKTKQLIQDYKKASGGFGIDKLEKSIKRSITKHQLPTDLKAYKKINVRKYNKYVNDELKHWAEHGKGSGKYFNIEHSTNPNLNISYRLDQKSNPSKILDASGKIIDRSFSVTDLLNKKIQNLSQADRLILLQNTTLDKATVSKVAKLTPGGKIMHHAAPVQSTSKIQEAFFKANPNLTMDDWIPIQRKVEKEFNFAFGDSPLNARYPETIAQHEQYHGLLREAGLYPNQLKFPKGLSPNDAYLKLKELAQKVLEIDKKVGVTPTYRKKTIGKEFPR